MDSDATIAVLCVLLMFAIIGLVLLAGSRHEVKKRIREQGDDLFNQREEQERMRKELRTRHREKQDKLRERMARIRRLADYEDDLLAQALHLEATSDALVRLRSDESVEGHDGEVDFAIERVAEYRQLVEQMLRDLDAE